jgi:nucleoside-diphosphate-sugar epimerase
MRRSFLQIRISTMRVFVTGATGWVGSATVKELLAAGHQVLGLARSDAGAATVAASGAEVQRGSLEDLGSLTTGARASDAVIHTAFNHDFSKFAENGLTEKRAIATLGEALVDTGRPLIVTSGTALLTPGRLATEDVLTRADSNAVPRDPEGAATAFASRGVRVSFVRLSPSTHGRGDHGFMAALIGVARDKGVSAFIGDGLNRWSAVHRLDAARLYRLVLEKGASGARYHAAADSGVPLRDLAILIGRHLNLPVISLSPEEAAAHFGWFARFAAIDGPASSLKTQDELGWRPVEPGLIADLDAGHYFGA